MGISRGTIRVFGGRGSGNGTGNGALFVETLPDANEAPEETIIVRTFDDTLQQNPQ